ncbi:MAG: hypothetical protein EPN93_17515 [Spirochaetes bacterium]|nr:MAG: hypothetical protein EPN93_17515 [Spirochaetota bacterium]
MKSLIENLSDLVAKANPVYHPTPGKVKAGSMDDTKGMCTVIRDDGKPDVPKVRLQAMFSPDFMIVPADGSKVIIAWSDNKLTRAFIVSVEKIRAIKWQSSPAGTVHIEATDAGITIENGAGKIMLTNQGVKLGDGTDPMVLGLGFQSWAQSVDLALSLIIAWGATVTPPLAGAVPPLSTPAILSQVNKLS